MRIGLITTLETNIGDDFIREGICLLLREIFKGQDIEFISVNKHEPLTAYPNWHPIQLSKTKYLMPRGKYLLERYIENSASKLKCSYFDRCDLIVQCGAPVFWPNCYQNEWAKPIWNDIIGRLYNKVPVLNIAAGSCYPWEKQPSKIESAEDQKYIRNILGYCRITTVRDCLSQKLCKTLGYELPLIPCSALLAAKGRKVAAKKSGYVLINYMEGGGHYDWEQNIDALQWENAIKMLIARLSKKHKIAFLCHDKKETLWAKKLDSTLPIFFPNSPKEYLDCVSESIFAICNRMHASVAMAGLGIPSVAVGTDTRLLMVSQIGLPAYYVKNVDVEMLEEETEKGISSINYEHERLLSLQNQSWKNYLSVMNEYLGV